MGQLNKVIMKFLSLLWISLMCGLFLFCLSCNSKALQKESLTIKVDKDSIPMGRSIMLTAHLNLKSGNLAQRILITSLCESTQMGLS